ncbi:MAG: quinohemoprotein amine dehydrogenase subunit beta, partial [Nitratireductor sp.]
SAVRDPNDKSKLYGVYTQLSKHDLETKELIKRVDLPHTYYCINISSDGKELYVGGTNDDIGIYDAETLERTGEILLPSGGDMAAGTLHVISTGS